MKQKIVLFSILIISFYACKKDGASTNKTTATQNTSAGKYLLFDADELYNSGKSSTPSLFTSLYRTNLDGSGLTRLTTPPPNYFDYRASISSDGSKIIFVRGNQDDTDRGLYTIDSAGNNLTNITKGNEVDYAFFSPDGAHVVYAKSLVDNVPYTLDVYVANADGSNEQKITSFANQNGEAIPVGWSQNGRMYIVAAGNSIKTGVYSINADGSGMQFITSNRSIEAISPDGKYFLFDSLTGLSICNIDGSNVKTVLSFTSNYPDELVGAAWSADEKEIYFLGYDTATKTPALSKVNTDGSGLTKVLNGYYEYPGIH
jgi:Tol biopolymer transport system component